MKGWAILLTTCLALPAWAIESPRYADDRAGSGLSHVYDGGWEFFVGGGVAAFDCDGDGRQDLHLAGGTNPSALYRNVSAAGGVLRFEALDDAAVALPDVTGAYPVDIDGDGILDLAVLRVGENVLLKGKGNCRFERANEAWGFDGGDAWTTAFAARWDEGRDWPTLAIGNYVDRGAPGSPFGTCHDNFIFPPKPEGDGFAEPVALNPGHCALSALFSDWDRSGERDLRLTNDRQYYRGGQEQLWRLSSEAAPRLYSRRDGWRRLNIWGMGIASHDVNEDGYPDYFLTSMGDNKLRVLTEGAKRPVFGDQAGKRGMTAHRPYTGGDILPSTGWHAEFRDVNNDSYMDLFIAKGNVEAMKDFASRDPNNLLLGHPDGRFENVGEAAGIANFARSRGATLADLNLDGLPDLVVVNRKVEAEVWRNLGAGTADQTVPMGNWLQLKLRQEGGNRNAVGAWIEVRIGARTLSREATVGGGHAGGTAGWIHFGVGTAERARVRVQWPDGEWSDWIRLYTNQFARITRGQSQAEPWLPPEGEDGS